MGANEPTGEFLTQKKDAAKFKGVRKEKQL